MTENTPIWDVMPLGLYYHPFWSVNTQVLHYDPQRDVMPHELYK